MSIQDTGIQDTSFQNISFYNKYFYIIYQFSFKYYLMFVSNNTCFASNLTTISLTDTWNEEREEEEVNNYMFEKASRNINLSLEVIKLWPIIYLLWCIFSQLTNSNALYQKLNKFLLYYGRSTDRFFIGMLFNNFIKVDFNNFIKVVFNNCIKVVTLYHIYRRISLCVCIDMYRYIYMYSIYIYIDVQMYI